MHKWLLNATTKEYSSMISFTFSIEHVRLAPPDVRRWFELEITAALAALSKPLETGVGSAAANGLM